MPGDPMLSGMFSVSDAEAAAIRAAYERGGELAAAVELRRRFPGTTDDAELLHHPGQGSQGRGLLG